MDKLQGLIRNFLWTGKESGRRNLVAWDTVCNPKNAGGLGIKELLSWNKASISRSIFEIVNNVPSLWLTWIKRNHLKGRNFWLINSSPSASWCWRSILVVRDELLVLKSVVDLEGIMVYPNGKYAAAEVYFVLKPQRPLSPSHSSIWGCLNPPRCSFITWIALHQCIPTLDKLASWGIPINNLCRFCNSATETKDHLWFSCSFSISVLNNVLSWLGIDSRFNDINGWLSWLASSARQNSFWFKFRSSFITNSVYYIWQAWNQIIHQQTNPAPADCVTLIKLSEIVHPCQLDHEQRSPHLA